MSQKRGPEAGQSIERLIWPHTGAVLTGGRGARLGGTKHQLTLADGTTFLDAVTATLAETCERVVVVGSAPADLHRLDDLRPGNGPLGGIEALLSSGLDTEFLVCPVDIPLVTVSLLRRLTPSSRAPGTIFAIEGAVTTEPLPARVSTEALPRITEAIDSGDLALHEVWHQLEFDRVSVSKAEAADLFNVNTPDDYDRLLRHS